MSTTRPRRNKKFQEEKPFKEIQPRNEEQADLIESLYTNDLIIISGVAGAGKTAIACGIAAELLIKGSIDKIILSRSCVGPENLGFLPGEILDKVTPYMSPLFTELGKYLNVKNEMDHGRIEVIPLAYMRGHTFIKSFAILEESQNATWQQIKLFLTRFGDGSKFVVMGDKFQSDLDHRNCNDFSDFIEKIKPLAENPDNFIDIIELCHSVRHPLVEKLLSIF